jgi:hypothetical protein
MAKICFGAGVHDLSERGMAAREKLSGALQSARETREKLEQRAREGVKATDRLVGNIPTNLSASHLESGSSSVSS